MATMAKKVTVVVPAKATRKATPYAKKATHRQREAKPVAQKPGGLQDRAMLVGLTVRRWHIGRNEKAGEETIAKSVGGETEMFGARKKLVRKDSISDLRNLEAALRSEHKLLTLPWGDDGYRILSSAGYMPYVKAMNELIGQYSAAADSLLEKYGELKAEAKMKLGTSYDEKDYPSPEALRRQYVAKIDVIPMPSAEDFRVELEGVDTEELRASIRADIEKHMTDAYKSVWERFKEVLDHAVERLKAYSTPKPGKGGKQRKGRLHESMLRNINELLDIVPVLNVMGDPAVTEFAASIKEKVAAYDIETLKGSDTVRTQVIDAAEDILSKMNAFLA